MKRVRSRPSKSLLGILTAVGLLCTVGCTTWHSASVLSGLDTRKDNRAIIKKAQNDPFPSPEQVGIK